MTPIQIALGVFASYLVISGGIAASLVIRAFFIFMGDILTPEDEYYGE